MYSVAETIRQHEVEIVQLWTEEARRAASARGLSRPELVNIFPAYVSSLAEPDEPLGTFGGKRRKLVEGHLVTRLRQGFDIAEIAEEFALLGRCIARVWDASPPSERPDSVRAERLFAELHGASTLASDLFAKHMLEDEQTEKRYRRLLQAIASEALEGGALPLRNRLKDVLQLVMGALGAQHAALLLFDAVSEKLVTAARVGAAEDAIEDYPAPLSPSSFVGRVATQADSTSMLDVISIDLQVADALKASGIHSLLGVRLAPRHNLLGVVYVGLREMRSFTLRETSRLESLAHQLAVHLDSARLFGEVVAKVRELQAQRELRELFVSVLAHDLRAPLTAVKISAQTLMRHPEKRDDWPDLAARIARNLERMDQMISDLLDANRIQAGEQLPLRLQECNLGSIAREVVEELVAIHGERFDLRVEEEVRGIWSSEELRRAVWNLASNAVKYGAQDKPITITVRRTTEGAEATVHNYGCFLSPEEQAHLFHPFARTRSAQTGSSRGWGLGLTLVHGCAEAHGGSVQIESSVEAGTKFILKLPLDARRYQSPADDAQSAMSEGGPQLH